MVKLGSEQLDIEIMDHERLFCTVLHLCALKSVRKAKILKRAKMRYAELIYWGPQSVRFHFQSEIPLGTDGN